MKFVLVYICNGNSCLFNIRWLFKIIPWRQFQKNWRLTGAAQIDRICLLQVGTSFAAQMQYNTMTAMNINKDSTLSDLIKTLPEREDSSSLLHIYSRKTNELKRLKSLAMTGVSLSRYKHQIQQLVPQAMNFPAIINPRVLFISSRMPAKEVGPIENFLYRFHCRSMLYL